MTKVICNQAEVCSQRDRCLAAKPHHPKLCGKPCSVDALAECVPVEEKVNGFGPDKENGCCQHNVESNHD